MGHERPDATRCRPRVTCSRDELEWIVDVGAALGGVASLIAVILGWISLRRAKQAQDEVIAEHRREAIRRRLQRLQDTALELAKLAAALDDASDTRATLHWRQLGVMLGVGNLGDELPKTRQIAQAALPKEGNAMRDLSRDVMENALPEVIAAIHETFDAIAASLFE